MSICTAQKRRLNLERKKLKPSNGHKRIEFHIMNLISLLFESIDRIWFNCVKIKTNKIKTNNEKKKQTNNKPKIKKKTILKERKKKKMFSCYT
jgi:hypothetical protein